MEGVNDQRKMYRWLVAREILHSTRTDIKNAVEHFLKGRGHFQPSWRAVIFALDGAGETDHANRIRHYAEPVQGRYMLCDIRCQVHKIDVLSLHLCMHSLACLL